MERVNLPVNSNIKHISAYTCRQSQVSSLSKLMWGAYWFNPKLVEQHRGEA